MNLQLEIPEPDEWDKSPQARAAIVRTVALTAQDLWGGMREENPTDHGRMGGAWELREGADELEWLVFNPVEYGPAVAFGAMPHVIVPRVAKALRFVVDGNVVYVKSVNHPGNPANLFWQRAMNATGERLSEFAEIALREQGLLP